MLDKKAYYRERRRKLTNTREEREQHPVRAFRSFYELTQRQLGRILGVSQQAVGQWETGECRAPAWVLEALEEQDEYLLRAIEKEKRKREDIY